MPNFDWGFLIHLYVAAAHACRQLCESADMCADMCVAVCADVCADMCIDICVDMCVDTGVHMYIIICCHTIYICVNMGA